MNTSACVAKVYYVFDNKKKTIKPSISKTHTIMKSILKLLTFSWGIDKWNQWSQMKSVSRVRSLKGLHLDELDCGKLIYEHTANTDALKEMKKLQF
jgi:hypothetical protein